MTSAACWQTNLLELSSEFTIRGLQDFKSFILTIVLPAPRVAYMLLLLYHRNIRFELPFALYLQIAMVEWASDGTRTNVVMWRT